MPPIKKKKIGQVTDAYWDEKLKGVRFTITFDPWGFKLSGTCKSGVDSATGKYVSPDELKCKVKDFLKMSVYDETGEYSSGERPSYEKIKKIRFQISLKSNRIGVSQSDYKPGLNTYLRYI